MLWGRNYSMHSRSLLTCFYCKCCWFHWAVAMQWLYCRGKPVLIYFSMILYRVYSMKLGEFWDSWAETQRLGRAGSVTSQPTVLQFHCQSWQDEVDLSTFVWIPLVCSTYMSWSSSLTSGTMQIVMGLILSDKWLFRTSTSFTFGIESMLILYKLKVLQKHLMYQRQLEFPDRNLLM